MSSPADVDALRPAAVGRPRIVPHLDAVTALSVLIVLLCAVPSSLRVEALGGAGAPSGLWGLACVVLWAVNRVHTARASARASYVRIATLVLLTAVLAAWTAAMLRPLPPLEGNAADLGVLRILSFCGIVLLTTDLATPPGRLVTLQRRLVLAGALVALLGLAQFVTGEALVDRVTFPGLVSSQDFSGVGDRGGFTRSAATAMSALEYTFTLAVVFPLALTFACFDRDRSLLRRVTPPVLIGAALLTSVSRSGLIGLAVGCTVLLLTWPGAVRRLMLALAPLALLAVYVLVPGMSGTLRYLFTASDSDPSAISRTGSYQVAAEFLAADPVVGRGFGTFLPVYRILDNQYLLLSIEVGAVGLLAFVGLLAAAAVSAHPRRGPDRPGPADLHRQLGHGLVASVATAALLTAFFDLFAFPMAVGTLALVCGMCGARRREQG